MRTLQYGSSRSACQIGCRPRHACAFMHLGYAFRGTHLFRSGYRQFTQYGLHCPYNQSGLMAYPTPQILFTPPRLSWCSAPPSPPRAQPLQGGWHVATVDLGGARVWWRRVLLARVIKAGALSAAGCQRGAGASSGRAMGQGRRISHAAPVLLG